VANAVVADRDADRRDRVDREHQDQVDGADQLVPEHGYRSEEGDERKQDGCDVDVAVRSGHPV
jgi:hypothetical protein